MKTRVFYNIFYIIVGLIFIVLANTVNSNMVKPQLVLSKQDLTWNLNDKMLLNFNLGFKRLESSLLWISTILESDIEHYKAKDLNSWMFLRFNTISVLEPKFYENYVFGGVYLSVIKDDISGASYLYKKGLSVYPNEYSLLKNAAFHFYFETDDVDTSYTLMKRLNAIPGKKSFSQTALSRLAAKRGDLEESFFLLNEYQKTYPTNTSIGRIIYDFRYSVKAEIDLNCLNNNIGNCSLFDLDKNPYRKVGNGFQAMKSWKPYRPGSKKPPL